MEGKFFASMMRGEKGSEVSVESGGVGGGGGGRGGTLLLCGVCERM